MKTMLCGLLFLLVAACGKETRPAPVGDPGLSRFLPGQVWTYKTRPGEEDSRLYICKVERYEKYGVIVHVYVDGLMIRNPTAATAEERLTPVMTDVHMPLLESALDESVLSLEKEGVAIPSYRSGYDQWRKALLAGRVRGGAYASPVAEHIEALAERRSKER